MKFKILEQDCSWMIDSSLDIKSKEYLEGIGVAEATFVMSSRNPPNDFIEYGSFVLVSDNIVNVLRKYENIEVTFSPITFIWNKKEYVKCNFYIMQVLREIECINYDESIYKCYASAPREISSISKLVIHPVDTDIHKIFIIENTCFICVNNLICDELVNNDCTGFTLTEVSDATI